MIITAVKPPLEVKPITRAQANRPELPMTSPSQISVHEVGNFNEGAREDMHYNFVVNGGGESAVSFHFINGPDKCIQILYLNENAWHASDGYYGPGNRDSIAIENVQVGDFNRTLNHLTWLLAELYDRPATFAWRPDYGNIDDLAPALFRERTWQHNFTAPDLKNCPQIIRQTGLWDALLEAVGRELEGRQRIGAVELAYAQPNLPDWWSFDAIEQPVDREINGVKLHYMKMTYTALRSVPVLNTVGGKKVRANLQIGEQVEGRYRFISGSGRVYVITRWGSRIAASALSPYISMRLKV